MIRGAAAVAVLCGACVGPPGGALDAGADADLPPDPDAADAAALADAADVPRCLAPADAGPAEASCHLCPGCPWQLETVDIGSGEFTSLVRGPDGTLHVAYEELGTGRLKHAWRIPGGVWVVEVVDQGESGYASLAVGCDGTLHIAYQWQAPGRLRYARRGPSDEQWLLQTVDEGGETGRYASLALADDGTVHIAYMDETNFDLRHAQRSPMGDWQVEVVASDSFVGLYATISVRPDGTVDMLHWEPNPNKLWHVEGSFGAWTSDVIHLGTQGPYPTLANGPDGALYAAYIDITSIEAVLWLAERQPGGAWTWSYVGGPCCDAGYHPSLVVDADGGVHLSYFHGAHDDLYYANRPPGGAFSFDTVAKDGNVGQFSSLLLDPDGGVDITFHDLTAQTLGHAHRPPLCD